MCWAGMKYVKYLAGIDLTALGKLSSETNRVKNGENTATTKEIWKLITRREPTKCCSKNRYLHYFKKIRAIIRTV